jgi:NitT/TauT family transport system substrate-binding protein
VDEEVSVRRRISIAGVAAALAVFAIPGGSALARVDSPAAKQATPLTDVKMGVFPAADFTPLFVGFKRGIFKKHGLDIKVQYIFTGTGLMSGLTSGALDVATNSVTAGVTGISNGLPVKLITIASLTPTKGYLEVLVRKDSSIRGWADLAGKTVATINLQGQFHLVVNNAIEKRGGNPSSMRALPMSPADEPAALAAGRVDAIVMQDPTLTQAKGQYDFRSLGNPVALLGYPLPSGGLYSSNDTIAKKPAVLRRFVTAWKEAVEVSKRNERLARQTLPKFTGITNETAVKVTLPDFSTALSPRGIGPMLVQMKKYGWISQVPSYQQLAWTGK